MTLKVGVTGGIGSGKSTVCSIFECLGIPVYYADDQAKWLMQNDQDLKRSIAGTFGSETYGENGELNREYLASVVFHDRKKLMKLNALVHPAVQKDVQHWFSKQKSPYAIEEAALIFEAGADKYLDLTINVSAPKSLRKRRVHRRDGLSYKEIESRMRRQWEDKKKSKMADFVIRNNEKNSLISQVWNIHLQIIRLNRQNK